MTVGESVGAPAHLQLRGVGRTYDDGRPLEALSPTSLGIERGDYVSITGPSGSGKSTLLNMIGLLDRPSRGSYLIGHIDTGDWDERTRTSVRSTVFGFVFQAFHLVPSRSVLENVELGMLYNGSLSPRDRRTRALAALDHVGLADRAASDPRVLSGGERQRVAIARAVGGEPAVILCDEPTGNLDSRNSESVLETLDGLNSRGLTVLVVTHEPEVAARAGRHVQVKDGTVSENGVPA